ncbi:efflux RND transporter periplasmic adaptor subunit [Vibrio sp. Of7-15]|uniref:efflux RND transporter periplasmic adaptor subunit n=1 Tax=Vibrio sp. Of7-15 TaxID=2724879 RepID=UPI001EF20DDE|nr:efflux RND transporter periplasmic adaptor subunit [Vibrio sp. Of7-15]MCG7495559.1 efflux RND transporter periplasmic adaptor subunit [Vibrio sp. Of7-15]
MKYFFIISFCFYLLGCKADQKAQEDIVDVIRSVKTINTQFVSHTTQRELAGVIKSTQTSPLSFKVSGTANKILVTKGTLVTQGQVLARLGQEEFTLAYNKAQASLGAAKAALIQAEDKYVRSEKLNQKGFVSDSELTGFKADFNAKEQQVKLSETDVRNAKLNLERTLLIAPFDGLISEVLIDDYTKVSSGQKVIELVNANSLDVDVLVPESLIKYLSFEQKVDIEIPALQYKVVQGEIAEIGAVVQKGNAYAVTVSILNPDTTIRNGMSANIIVNFGGTDSKAIILPLSAVNFDDTSAAKERRHASIYVVNETTMQLEKRYVSTERTLDNEFRVFEGLAQGEKVVVAGVPFLYPGQKVKIWQSK